jgi:predicted 2-oxoglutarate/Fe(II)-dependent dioxygenase YbiX
VAHCDSEKLRKVTVSGCTGELIMVAARDILARTLSGEVKTASSVEITAAMDDLTVHVEGFGRVRFPLTPSKVRKLIEFGEPARFGRGAETLTDPNVRDTWEIPKRLVSAVWNDASLADILATVKDELGLPHRAELTADLHSFLVYEPDQFFLAHQDSEKDDSMIGTLVVTLPSTYAGGELIVGRDEELKAYRGSRSALSLVAFYADCRHEVLRVKSGYRITLTYNLLLRGDTARPEGDTGTIAELTDLLREHFATPAPRQAQGRRRRPSLAAAGGCEQRRLRDDPRAGGHQNSARRFRGLRRARIPGRALAGRLLR